MPVVSAGRWVQVKHTLSMSQTRALQHTSLYSTEAYDSLCARTDIICLLCCVQLLAVRHVCAILDAMWSCRQKQTVNLINNFTRRIYLYSWDNTVTVFFI